MISCLLSTLRRIYIPHLSSIPLSRPTHPHVPVNPPIFENNVSFKFLSSFYCRFLIPSSSLLTASRSLMSIVFPSTFPSSSYTTKTSTHNQASPIRSFHPTPLPLLPVPVWSPWISPSWGYAWAVYTADSGVLYLYVCIYVKNWVSGKEGMYRMRYCGGWDPSDMEDTITSQQRQQQMLIMLLQRRW